MLLIFSLDERRKLMQAYQIIYGFSGIKSELRTKIRILKPIEKLELWFSIESSVLYAHDADDHPKCLALAIYDASTTTWRYLLSAESYEDMLVRDICESTPVHKVLDEIIDRFNLYGYIPL
jgi:hypothetical protein